MSDNEKSPNERSFDRNHDRSPNERNTQGRKHSRSRSRSRSRSGDGDRRSRRRYDDRCELRLLIQSKDAGSIIGRGGANIKRLRQDFKAGITISDSRAPERIVVVTGEYNAIGDVLDEILTKCFDEKRDSRDSRDSNRRESKVETKMLIHQSQAGCVIGKAGNKLKEMRQDYRVDMKVYSQCCPRSSERVVLVIGQPHDVCKCITAVLDLLRTWPPRGQSVPYDPATNYDDFAVRDYGGYEDDDRGRRDRGRGRRSSESRDRSSSLGGMSGASGLSSLSTLLGGGGGRRTSQQVSIPSELAGVIIGKGGQNIRQIRMDSGAEVELSDPAGSGDRVITITGSIDQIQNAQYLLQMSVKQHLARN